MFIGHYAAAPLAATPWGRKTLPLKLWHGFIAVQLVDYIWAIFILLGIEHGQIVPGITEANPLDLHFMPYTHSLIFTLFWALLGGAVYKLLTRSEGYFGATIFGMLVLSHWAADVLVHIPDMTFWPGSLKIGIGLWKHVWVSLPLELGLMYGGFAIYLKSTTPKNQASKTWAALFIAFLSVLQIYSNFGPTPTSLNEVAASALLAFTVLAFCAAKFEKTRLLTSSRENSALS